MDGAGWIVPTGSVDALLERLTHLRMHPLRKPGTEGLDS